MEATSGFPRFMDGDVTIAISANKIYQLHSHTLRRASPLIARLIDAYPPAKLTAAARRDGCTPYRLELRQVHGPEGLGTFLRVRVGENGRLIRDGDMYSVLGSGTLGQGGGQDKYWDWLFGSFYNITPKFEDHNLATVLHSCMGLVDAAEAVEAIEQIREHVDLALMRQDQVLWQSIAANPTAWTELGCRVHSPTIFREGVIHLIGLWQKMTDEERSELRPEIFQLVEFKWQELHMAKQAIDLRILGHYPAFLSRSYVDKPHRTSYSTDIYMWMAISFFRHWYAQAISEGRNRVAPDGGFEFYTTLSKGGNAYLHHEDFKTFHQFFPMSSKACNVLEANMNVIKEDVKLFVQDLVKVRSHFKNTDFQVSWLTCALVNKEDFPWEKASMAKATIDHEQLENVMGLQGEQVISSPLTSPETLDFDLSGFSGSTPTRCHGSKIITTANLG